jgi:nitrate reductase (cytochrome), electron transfer subunit
MSNTQSNTPHPDLNRGVSMVGLFGAVVTGVALAGFLQGIAEPRPAQRAPFQHRRVATLAGSRATLPARSYSEMPGNHFSPNSDWSSSLADLRYTQPDLFAPVHRTTEMKLSAIADRALSRAFDGAPPVIPHPVAQQSDESCLACHKDGVRIGQRLAPRVSHAHFASCTQCHVETQTSGPFAAAIDAQNDFVGLYRSGPGTRTLIGAPPTIPHSTWLREDCMSCHGLTARPGLRTTHPWLSNCVQCHVADAELNQSDFLAGGIND